jgi:DNA-binding transcriptional MerR regulator
MNLNIKEFSKIMGLSVDTLRYYEKCGLISPKRNKNNKYREYTEYEGIDVLRAKQYNSFGISLGDTITILNKENTIEQQYEWLNLREREVDSKLNELILLKNRIHDLRRTLSYGMRTLNSPMIDFLPATYHLAFDDESISNIVFGKVSKEWVKYISLANIIVFLPYNIQKQDVDDGILKTYLGLGIFKRDMELLDSEKLINKSIVKELHEGKGLFMRLVVDDVFLLKRSNLEPLFTYIKNEGYKIIEDLSIIIHDLHIEDGQTKYSISVRAKIEKRA